LTQGVLTLVPRSPIPAKQDHARAFLARYEALRAYSLRLTNQNRSLADDLVQDAYIQFTVAQPDLERIQNLDGYLAVLVRHLHISSIRRTAAHRFAHVPIHDDDSAELAWALARNDDAGRARDGLIAICEYACARKDTSKAASVLILRFFHGFYPPEIARILRAPLEWCTTGYGRHARRFGRSSTNQAASTPRATFLPNSVR
jgi:DNA-directed RNA polymerase specialized sigma24 family protein